MEVGTAKMSSKSAIPFVSPGPLGVTGLSEPDQDPINVDRAYVETLIDLSLRGLERMYDESQGLLFSVDFEGGARETVAHLGKRYTVMSSLGIHEAQSAGYSTTLDARALLETGINTFEEEAIDHLAMGLWADCTIGSALGDSLAGRLRALLDGTHTTQICRVLGWALTALSLHWERCPDDSLKKDAERLYSLVKEKCWHPSGQLFRTRAEGSFGFIRNMALFSTQIYWVYAFATYGRIFENQDAINISKQCAHKLIELRDSFAGWPWRYDASRGTVTERYPVYSVHQDAMAPMALHALQDASGETFGQVNRESMGWLYRNELGVSMVNEEEEVIYRAIRRRFPFNRMAYQSGWSTAFFKVSSPFRKKPWALRLNGTCRPYHLGWVLHAWCGREDRINLA